MRVKSMDKERKKIIVSFSLYLVFYLIAFAALEQRKVPMNMVMTKFDHLIPFCEYFVVPYFFWFLYLIVTGIYFGFFCEDVNEVKKLANSFMMGMSVFLLVSLFFPNGHLLRPVIRGEGFFISLVEFLYSIDTSTNVFPSMHVFCTNAAAIALLRQKNLTRRKGFTLFVHLMTILIVLSTLFLKQHSVIDAVGAILLNGVCYGVFYRFKFHLVKKKLKTMF